MTDAEFYERQRQIHEAWKPATLEQMAIYGQSMIQSSAEMIQSIGPQLQNDPYLVKLVEMEERAKLEPEVRFTRWCRGARKWEE